MPRHVELRYLCAMFILYSVFCILNVSASALASARLLLFPAASFPFFSRFPFATAESIKDLQQRQRIISARNRPPPSVSRWAPRPGLAPFPSRV